MKRTYEKSVFMRGLIVDGVVIIPSRERKPCGPMSEDHKRKISESVKKTLQAKTLIVC